MLDFLVKRIVDVVGHYEIAFSGAWRPMWSLLRQEG